MVVDDHPVMRIGLMALVNEQAGMTIVAEAADGRQAVELFARHKPDITMMDLRLPGMSGAEVIASIRQEFPASRFIVLTTYDGDEDIYRAFAAGAQAYVLKGMTHEELLDAIRIVHTGGRYIPPDVERRLAARPPNSALTARELEVLELIVQGRSNREIADLLSIKETTVKWFVKSVFLKLYVRDRAQAVAAALQRGIVRL